MRKRFLALTLIAIAGGNAAFAQSYEIDWYTIDAGGQMFSTGGIYELGATIGQPDAGPVPEMAGGVYALEGGFWVDAVALPCGGYHPCDTNCDGSINLFDIDPFVAVILTRHGCSPCSGDTNGDGTTNLFDIQRFVECLAP